MSSKPKVLVILSPGFAASEEDTGCLPMQQAFVRALSQVFIEGSVTVLSFHYPFVRSTYDWFDASVVSFNGKNRGGIQGMLMRKRVESALEQIHREKEIVGLLSFWFGECAMIGKRFAEEKGLRHCCWILGQDARAGNKYVASLSIEGNDLIALSDSLQEEFERNYGIRPQRVITPGMEAPLKRNECGDIDLLAVGSLITLKRFELFLEAVARIGKELPGIKAMLVGDGPEYKRLRRMASDLGIADTVSFTGSIGHEEVLKKMSRAKVLLHPSSYEGYSGVCQEALSCGAHVISFCWAMREDTRQWHVVKTKEEMVKKAIAILKDGSARFEQVEFQPMTFTARRIMELFICEETLRLNKGYSSTRASGQSHPVS